MEEVRSTERFNSECSQPSVKQNGGSAKVWICISAGGGGELVKTDGVINTEKYHYQILM